VRRTEQRDALDKVCRALGSARLWIRGIRGNMGDGVVENSSDVVDGGSDGVFRAAETGFARRLIPKSPGAKSVYHIAIRFRDGSRHVFDETTPRTLQLGERVQVITADGWAPNGRV